MNTRTNIVLDDKLIAQAMERAGVKTKKAAVEAALKAFVRKPDYRGLLALEGSRLIADDYDPKALFTHERYGTSEPIAKYKAPARRKPAKKAAGK